ncbi:MAG: hypothetical protein JWP37_1332 [Mucilaginibacter sp.]|nr:hypothetical protein [Mucilaginibacter sp.]
MRQQSGFLPEHQFHILINFNDDERSVTVLPNEAGKFLVVDQGKVLGELDFDKHLNCVSYQCELDPAIISQLNKEIRNHYS